MLRSIVSRNSTFTRGFRSFAPVLVQAGQAVPTAAVHENSPGNSVNLAAETASGKSIIVGVPGAFSPACSASHAPGYIKLAKEFQAKGVSNIYIVAVNDAFVTKAWSEQLGNDADASHVRFIADASGAFSKEFGSLIDEASKFFGNARTQRYAAIVEDGKVKEAFVEPDNFGLEVSKAENVLKAFVAQKYGLPEMEVKLEDPFIMVEAGDGEMYGLWLFHEGDRPLVEGMIKWCLNAQI